MKLFLFVVIAVVLSLSVAYRIGQWDASYTMSFPPPVPPADKGFVQGVYAHYDKPIHMQRVCGEYRGQRIDPLTPREAFDHLAVFILPNGDILVCKESL